MLLNTRAPIPLHTLCIPMRRFMHMPRAVGCRLWATTRLISVPMIPNWVVVGRKWQMWLLPPLHQIPYAIMLLHLWYGTCACFGYLQGGGGAQVVDNDGKETRACVCVCVHTQVNTAALKQVLQQQQTASIFDVRAVL